MKLFKSLLCWASAAQIITASASFNSLPREQLAFGEHWQEPVGLSHGVELASLSTSRFSVLTHPAFPGRSARIKKSLFCDGKVASYTGYIDVGVRHLFFYFFESRDDPDKDDVVLWTNGGPGGSSALGMLMELGPCSIQDGNTTKYNPHSWNAHANIFFIDQPVGVGFSYSDTGEIAVRLDPDPSGETEQNSFEGQTSSEEAAKDIAAFVATFFEAFPKFKGRGLHLSGESYAGRYLPVYASEIYDQNANLLEKGLAPINLQSILIGNGATNFFHLAYSWYDIACTSAALKPLLPVATCVRMKAVLPRCKRGIQQKCIDSLDLLDCKGAFDFCQHELGDPFVESGINPYDVSKKCETGNDLCYKEVDYIVEYLNQPWIREEVGADPSSRNFTPTAYDILNAFVDSGDMLHLTETYVSALLERGVRVLIYAGTYDWVGNWVANERWTLEMEWSGREEFRAQPLAEWAVDGEPVGQFRSYGNLTFATVYGGGHMVPYDKPAEALELVKRWLSNKKL